jgi:hypothetical protein
VEVLRSKAIIGLLVLLSLIAAVVAAACSSGEGKEPTSEPAVVTSTSPTAAAATPSPFPTARPTLGVTDRFKTIHYATLPTADDGSAWLPAQPIPGSRLFLVVAPQHYLPCPTEGCQYPPGDPNHPGRLGFWNIDTGAVDEFHSLQTGYQLPATASEGRYLAWIEGCDHGEGGPWRLYVMDLSTRESWYADSDLATSTADDSLSGCPSAIAISNGHLVYSMSIANLSGTYVNEVRTYDLGSRTRSKLMLSGDVPPVNIGCGACGGSDAGLVVGGFLPIYAAGGQIVWVGSAERTCGANSLCQAPNALYATDVSSGNTTILASDLDHGGLLRYLTGNSQGRNESVSLWADYVQVTSGFVLWLDLPENVAMAYDLNSDDLIKLSDSDCSAEFVAADDNAIYWACGNQLNWVDLPQP